MSSYEETLNRESDIRCDHITQHSDAEQVGHLLHGWDRPVDDPLLPELDLGRRSWAWSLHHEYGTGTEAVTETGSQTTQSLGQYSWESSVSRRASIASTSSDDLRTSVISEPNRFIQWTSACGRCLSSIAGSSVARTCWAPIRFLSIQITKRLARSRFHGWRVGVLLGIISSSVILCINMVVLITTASTKGGYKSGFATPFNHDRATLLRLNIVIHILINACGTILLATSNYTLQALASPTRLDLDKAHKAGRYFDIGVLSVRNLTLIPRKRLILCIILGLSSLPLHLLYNSSAIYIASTNLYEVQIIDSSSSVVRALNTNTSYEKIPNRSWASYYDTPVVHHGVLIFVVDWWALYIDSGTLLKIDGSGMFNVSQSSTWPNGPYLPGGRDIIRGINLNATGDMLNFTHRPPFSGHNYAHIKETYSQKLPERDRIVFGLYFVVTVIVCNTTKLVAMLFVLLFERDNFLVTLGDCATSFLQIPDSSTAGMCTYSKEAIVDHAKGRNSGEPIVPLANEETALEHHWIWKNKQRSYINSVHPTPSLLPFLLTCFVAVTITIWFAFAYSVTSGWGTTSERVLGSGRFHTTISHTYLLALLINTPQLLLSILYKYMNRKCTILAGVLEWNNLAVSRKSLRVTNRTGEQRSTYNLQLPYRWSVPLITLSAIVHWMLSQTIFLVRIDCYDMDGGHCEALEHSPMGCGFSGLSTIVLWAVV